MKPIDDPLMIPADGREINRKEFRELFYSLRNRRQSEDRIHRIGQKRSCTYYDLVLVGTLDEQFHHDEK